MYSTPTTARHSRNSKAIAEQDTEAQEAQYWELVQADADAIESLLANLEQDDTPGARLAIGRIVNRYPSLIDPEQDSAAEMVTAVKDYAYATE